MSGPIDPGSAPGHGGSRIDAEIFREQNQELEAKAERYAELHPHDERGDRTQGFRGIVERFRAAMRHRR